jgi:hypothetical protein
MRRAAIPPAMTAPKAEPALLAAFAVARSGPLVVGLCGRVPVPAEVAVVTGTTGMTVVSLETAPEEVTGMTTVALDSMLWAGVVTVTGTTGTTVVWLETTPEEVTGMTVVTLDKEPEILTVVRVGVTLEIVLLMVHGQFVIVKVPGVGWT